MNFTSLQKKMIAQGATVLFVGMLAGFGLVMSLVGGMELVPGNIIEFTVPGDSRAWARAHAGGILNGMLVLVVAVIMGGIGCSQALSSRLYWMLVGTGWANTVFYWAALFAPNRALTFADNTFGESNLASIIGLAPALLFAVIALVAVFLVMRQAYTAARGEDRFPGAGD